MQLSRVGRPCKLLVTTPKPALHISPKALLVTSTSQIVYRQIRASSFLRGTSNSSPSPSRQPQKTTRESWFTRRKKQRNTRSKISTLALDRSASPFEIDAQRTTNEHHYEQEQGERDEEQSTKDLMSPRNRRLLLLALAITMPAWGRDIIEAVIPGMLGIFILVAGKIKGAVKWLRLSKQEYDT